MPEKFLPVPVLPICCGKPACVPAGRPAPRNRVAAEMTALPVNGESRVFKPFSAHCSRFAIRCAFPFVFHRSC